MTEKARITEEATLPFSYFFSLLNGAKFFKKSKFFPLRVDCQ